MVNPIKSKDSFVTGRAKGIKYALRGAYLLIKTEDSIKAQLVVIMLIFAAGFAFEISTAEWLFQLLAISIVLAAESLNSAIEKLCDFIHPEHHPKIGFIKDISAGAVAFSAVIAIVVGGIIYVPRVVGLF